MAYPLGEVGEGGENKWQQQSRICYYNDTIQREQERQVKRGTENDSVSECERQNQSKGKQEGMYALEAKGNVADDCYLVISQTLSSTMTSKPEPFR